MNARAPLLALVVAALTVRAHAHPLSFGVLSVEELAPERYALELRFSGDEDAPSRGAPRIDETCRLEDAVDIPLDWGVHIRGVLICPGGLVGKQLGVVGLEGTEITVQLRVLLEGEDPRSALLTATDPLHRIDRAPSPWSSAVRYVELGVEHIALGFDHLLLVLGLLLASRGPRALVGTVTAFTVGHSLTLAGASLGLVRVASPPVEACIALSLVFVAHGLVRDPHDATSPRSPPWAVAIAFGLLHGFGFAGALADVGLPERSLVHALVGFNLGVEVGQLAFVGMVLGVFALLRRVSASAEGAARRWAPVVIGAFATSFFLERLLLLGT